MDYATLARWAQGASPGSLLLRLQRWEDQARLVFEDRALQCHLSSGDCWCFFSQNSALPWADWPGPIADALYKCRLRAIHIAADDRILFFDFDRVNLFNAREHYRLILELAPRFANLVLTRVEGNDLVIVDALRRFSFADNPVRQVLPGAVWVPPPPPPALDTTRDAASADVNCWLEARWYEGELPRRLEALRKQALAKLDKDIAARRRKLEKQQAELNDAAQEQTWRRYAELLKTELHRILPGQTELAVTDWYADGQPQATVPLLPELSPRQNMEHWFRKARKARSGREEIARQMQRTADDIEELERARYEVETEDDYAALREHLAKPQRGGQNAETTRHGLTLAPGWEVFVGRTSTENDQLTTRFAKPLDWWFHCRVFRGAHVVLRNYAKGETTEAMILLCARLAAYYSRASKSQNVPVDYTQIRYVRKPRNSAPGFVTYSNQKTLFVDPLSMREAARTVKG